MSRSLFFTSAVLVTTLIAGCGSRRAESSKSAPKVEQQTGGSSGAHNPLPASRDSVFAEPLPEAAKMIRLALSGLESGDDIVSAHAYKIDGGPAIIHVSVYNDWEFEGLGQRRTVLLSQTYFPRVSRSDLSGDDEDVPAEYSFAQHGGRVVVLEGDPFRVVVQKRSEIQRGDHTSTHRSTFNLPIDLKFSRVENRLRRAFTKHELQEHDEHAPFFKVVTTAGSTTNASLQLRLALEAGKPEKLFSQWPVTWGPDDTPVILDVSVMRLPLPVEYDVATLRQTITRLRGEVEAGGPTASRFLLAVCLDMLSAMDQVEEGDRRRIYRESVEQMRQAVAQEPWRPVYHDRLRWDLYSLAWQIAQSEDYAEAPDLLDEMLQHLSNFNDFDHAARTVQQCVYSVSDDDSLNDAEKKTVRRQYAELVADYLRRGLQFEVDHGGIDVLRYRHRWLRSVLDSSVFSNSRHLEQLLTEFETERAVVMENIEKLKARAEEEPGDGGLDYLLAAAHEMLARLSDYSDPNLETPVQTALDYARQAVTKAPENAVYQRRLQRQLLSVGWTVGASEDYQTVVDMVKEALKYEACFEDYVVGARNIWRASLESGGGDDLDDQVRLAATKRFREAFFLTLQAGFDSLGERETGDRSWIIEQLPAAVPYPATKWEEFDEFMCKIRGQVPNQAGQSSEDDAPVPSKS